MKSRHWAVLLLFFVFGVFVFFGIHVFSADSVPCQGASPGAKGEPCTEVPPSNQQPVIQLPVEGPPVCPKKGDAPAKIDICVSKSGKEIFCFDPTTEECKDGRSEPKCEWQLKCGRLPAIRESESNPAKWCCPVKNEEGINQVCNPAYGFCLASRLRQKESVSGNPRYTYSEAEELCKVGGTPKCANDYVSSYYAPNGLGGELQCKTLPSMIGDNFDPQAILSQIPANCTCENSSLVIVGADVILPSAHLGYYNAAINHCNALAKQLGQECTFTIVVDSRKNMETLKNILPRRFKYVSITSHGTEKESNLTTGGAVGALTCGNSLFLSCKVGQSPFLGMLGTPPVVVDYCKQAPAGSKVMVSKSLVVIPINDNFCAEGDFKCFQCLSAPLGWAKDVYCNGNEIPVGIVKTSLSKEMREEVKKLEKLLRQRP